MPKEKIRKEKEGKKSTTHLKNPFFLSYLSQSFSSIPLNQIRSLLQNGNNGLNESLLDVLHKHLDVWMRALRVVEEKEVMKTDVSRRAYQIINLALKPLKIRTSPPSADY
jgi:hypothetical protein